MAYREFKDPEALEEVDAHWDQSLAESDRRYAERQPRSKWLWLLYPLSILLWLSASVNVDSSSRVSGLLVALLWAAASPDAWSGSISRWNAGRTGTYAPALVPCPAWMTAPS